MPISCGSTGDSAADADGIARGSQADYARQESHWRGAYAGEPYHVAGYGFEDYAPAYLVHEFMPAAWQPLYVTEVRRDMVTIGFEPVGGRSAPAIWQHAS